MGCGASTSGVNPMDNIAVKADLKDCKLDQFEKHELLGDKTVAKDRPDLFR